MNNEDPGVPWAVIFALFIIGISPVIFGAVNALCAWL